MKNESIIIGDEYDNKLINLLFIILKEMGDTKINETEALAGSQDYYLASFNINNSIITVEIETYIGITLNGPSELIRIIMDRINNKS